MNYEILKDRIKLLIKKYVEIYDYINKKNENISMEERAILASCEIFVRDLESLIGLREFKL